jgi:Protein of unknown function (DUF3618)
VSSEQSSLEREIEDTRERLATTIDQLVHRANPKTIVGREISTIRAHFVGEDGSPRTDNILRVVGGVLGVVAVLVALRRITR